MKDEDIIDIIKFIIIYLALYNWFCFCAGDPIF